MTNVTNATVTLRSGLTMPQVGLGVWQSDAGGETREACLTAFREGYRHVDSARIYGNEADVGEAVRAAGIPREELWITTKVWNDDQGYDKTLRAFDRSLERLGLDYVDLYLVHWPVAKKRSETWRAMEAIKAGGRARSIGVSNFLVPHLEELLGGAKEVPEVNQIELHPFLQHRETRALCKKHGIVIQGYSPLTRGRRLDHPAIAGIAKELGRTPAQVILRWGIQHGHVILPKSVRAERIRENALLFDFALDAAQMAALDALDDGTPEAWDPRNQA